MSVWRVTVNSEGKVFETGPDEDRAADTFRAVADLAAAIDDVVHVHVSFADLVVLDGDVTARVEWPFPAFFWRWLDRLTEKNHARFDPVTAAVLTGDVTRWTEDGRKNRLLLDDDRRESLRRVVLALLAAGPELGLDEGERDDLYESMALICWASAQPDLILSNRRKEALNLVLSTADDLIQQRAL